MPLKRKAVWYCCPRSPDEQKLGYKPTVEVTVGVENSAVTDQESWAFGFKLTESEAKKLKFCPACGTKVPDTISIATLEGLTDNEG